ncbi:12.5K [Bat adenovirus 2]|uniref:12.5K n=2 Tax=Mastadenovirus TaxID=10509 RepID=A0A894JFA4_9ADEN|nr:12.5K [Bat adenovirus 2]AEM06282.1 12.5K [Bat adenovirus 2]QDA77092.1 12.5K [Bat mastadenovirus B]QRV11593.1 12.5K [Bat mastadenovirus]QRV11634.1 12.5K [Bat mastadenovirus]
MATTNTCQVEVDCLCLVHEKTCTYPRCFVRQNLKPVWFHNPPLDNNECVVIDSYQEGHGLSLSVKCFHHSTKLGKQSTLLCSKTHSGSEILIRCECKKPAPHKEMIQALCHMYNLN